MSIEVRHISKSFGAFHALRDVSLRVNDGELVALLGPSGSGKTTLLRIIAGLEVPDPSPECEILFHDSKVTDRSVRQRRVGFVFQHYALFRHMTVFENIAFGLRVRPRSTRPPEAEIQRRVHELLGLIQLDELGKRYPPQLSGGQRQRVALARALAAEPKVLLLDEPFGALDAKVRQALRSWLRKLHQEIHLTSVLVTHDQEEALEVADRIVVMNRGRIEQAGTPEEVFHQPRTPFVMEFLGQVNVFHARVSNGQAQVGDVLLECPEFATGEERTAKLYFRPHELELERYSNGKAVLQGKVLRINPAGASAKVILSSADGTEVQVDLSLERFRELDLKPGESVYVYNKAPVKLFTPDYSI